MDQGINFSSYCTLEHRLHIVNVNQSCHTSARIHKKGQVQNVVQEMTVEAKKTVLYFHLIHGICHGKVQLIACYMLKMGGLFWPASAQHLTKNRRVFVFHSTNKHKCCCWFTLVGSYDTIAQASGCSLLHLC